MDNAAHSRQLSEDSSFMVLMRQLADLTGTPLEYLQGDSVLPHFRTLYDGNLMFNAGISPAHGEQLLRRGLGKVLAFGREYIANPESNCREPRDRALAEALHAARRI